MDLWCPGIIIVVDHPPNVNPPSWPLSHCGPLHHSKESAGKEQRGPLPLKRTVDQTASPKPLLIKQQRFLCSGIPNLAGVHEQELKQEFEMEAGTWFLLRSQKNDLFASGIRVKLPCSPISPKMRKA